MCPPMPRQDGIGDKAPTLCCASVASSWHAHSTTQNCGVGNVRILFFHSFCASPSTFLKVLESSSGKESGPGRGPECAAGH